jgi:anti-sigma factor RsiW
MTREFPDELLSALLDGELSDTERAKVERHLAENPTDRQLYQDLKSLRGELASLPQATVSSDFADRVVRAALAEAEKHNEARGMVSRAPPVERHFWRRWKYGVAAASAAALAACLLLVVLAGRHKDAPQPGVGEVVASGGRKPTEADPRQAIATIAALPDQLLAALTTAAPKNRDAVVLRLKARKDVSLAQALDAALAKAGISPADVGAAGPSVLLREAYAKMAPAGAETATLAAADAIFIEAPLQSIQDIVTDLASAIKDPLQLELQGKLALHRGNSDDRAEGEGGNGNAANKPFAQHLDASHFRLFQNEKAPAAASSPSLPVATLRPDQAIRILILVEQ